MDKTVFYQSQPEGAGRLLWLEKDRVRLIALFGRQTVGRQAGESVPDISTQARYISRQHGMFLQQEGTCLYRDVGSQNGTWLNGRRLETMEVVRLRDGDVLHFGGASRGGNWGIPAVFVTRWPGELRQEVFTPDANTGAFQVGRGIGQGLRLTEQDVSRLHCIFRRTMQGWAVENCSQTNPTRCNGAPVEGLTAVGYMDVVRIGSAYALYDGQRFLFCFPEQRNRLPERQSGPQSRSSAPLRPIPPAPPADNSRIPPHGAPPYRPAGNIEPAGEEQQLEIHILRRRVKRWWASVDLLKDIRLSVGCGELVLILGGSGAGKTTFLNAVMGYEPAEGDILFGGNDVYRNYDRMKYEIGYVPQEDLLRRNDTVIETLSNAAEMKLPRTISEAERQQRVQETLVTFGLERERESLVGKLSGGQRKRLSIAVEYIGQPTLFFLDEPDSGLDGIMARSLMENLRFIADTGRIVMVITHGPDRAVDLFDKVVVLAKSSQDGSGRLAFYGSCQEALRFFDAASLEGIVRRINRPDEGGDGMADYFIDRYAREYGGQL